MTPDQVFGEMKAEFLNGRGRGKPRKYVGGLLPAFCDFLLELGVPGRGYTSLDDLFRDFPQITEGVSTLTVKFESSSSKQKTIRPAYEAVHRYYIHDNKRLDYPRSQPYATGKWSDYRSWLDAMVSFTKEELERLRDDTKAFVLEQLAPQIFDPSTVKSDPPIFAMLLNEFDFGARGKGEPTGAAFQAMVFAFIRADAPHLQVEGKKVRVGSARIGDIGDIDAWEGPQLVKSAEVKHFVVGEDIISELEYFTSEVQQRGAMGLVVAQDFREGVREKIEALKLIPLSLSDIASHVRLWDPLKQRAALTAFLYIIVHREQNSALIKRVDDFLVAKGYKHQPEGKNSV